MFEKLTFENRILQVHLAKISLSITKAFTHGGIVFTPAMAIFKNSEPLPLPPELIPCDGLIIQMQLVGPEGKPRQQTRTIKLVENKNEPGRFFAPGMSRTPRRFSPEDGWGISIYRFRAYFTHVGVESDPELPGWIAATINRQRGFWNRLAYLCREARRECSDVAPEEIAAFVTTRVAPAIDGFNRLPLDPSSEEKHSPKLRLPEPDMGAIRGLIAALQKRIKRALPVPTGLLDELLEFVDAHQPDYAPIETFVRDFNAIANSEAKTLGLRWWEAQQTMTAFRAAMRRRRTAAMSFRDGWPRIRYPDSPGNGDWGIHFYLNKSGVPASDLDSERGVPGLRFGPRMDPALTGHPQMSGRRKRSRALRQAVISLTGDQRKQQSFTFAVLQHRDFPPASHIKEWKLIQREGALWLSITVEHQRQLPKQGDAAAGLDIGWRKIGDSIRVAMLYEPVGGAFQEIKVNLSESPGDPAQRKRFHLDMGANRWIKRHLPQLLPGWTPGMTIPSVMDISETLQRRRAELQSDAKLAVAACMDGRVPEWFNRIGRRGLMKMLGDPVMNVETKAALTLWANEDARLGKLVSSFLSQTARGVEYGHLQIAHDICQHLRDLGIYRLNIESTFLARASRQRENGDAQELRVSQRYRHFVAPGRLIASLRATAPKYGITVESYNPTNSSRTCYLCGGLNAATSALLVTCAHCGQVVDQDRNASVILSRMGGVKKNC